MKYRTYSSQICLAAMLMASLTVLAISCHPHFSQNQTVTSPFSFGLIADCQYCQIEGTRVRKYSMSDSKLKECVTHLNTLDLAYTIHLGDFIDRDWESFDVVNPIYQQLKMPAYHVLGNHDFSVEDARKGMVDTEQNSYGVIQVFRDHLNVVGYGREENRKLTIDTRHFF